MKLLIVSTAIVGMVLTSTGLLALWGDRSDRARVLRYRLSAILILGLLVVFQELDIGWPGWVVLAVLVPLVALAFSFVSRSRGEHESASTSEASGRKSIRQHPGHAAGPDGG
jgi:hypothetical protein